MKKNFLVLTAGTILVAVMVLVSSCRKEVYTDEDALEAMKEAIKYKNDLEKELMALQLTNQLQLEGLRSQLSIKEMRAADSLERVGTKVTVSIQVQDVTGNTTDMSGFNVTTNQGGTAKTLITDTNGFVVFPDCISGTASFVVSKTGFVRASGILVLGDTWYDLSSQQAIIIPVFPTNTATAKISGVLNAQLDLLTEAPEAVKDGIVSLSFDDIWDMFNNPNSTMDDIDEFGLAGLTYDGGFMQTVRTGADGKYEFLIPKTKSTVEYDLIVSTIQRKQRLLYAGYPAETDSTKLDSLPVYFGYQSNYYPLHDYVGSEYNYDNYGSAFAGVNIKIDAPTGGQVPTSPATISWVHNDSTVVTWSFTKFSFGDGSDEFTNITQTPIFSFSPNLSKVSVVTPAAGAINIVNGKAVSLYMTNGGQYKEFGRFWTDGIVSPSQATSPKFKFFEQLAIDNPSTYKTAIADASIILDGGRVKVTFKMDDDGVTRPGKGYTAVPNVRFRLRTPNTTDSVLTNANLKINLLAGGGLSIDPIVLDDWYTSTTGFLVVEEPVFGTYKRNGTIAGGNYYITATQTSTFKVDLLNGFKITDGGLGYANAPKVRVQNYARKQGTTGGYVMQTIAEAPTVLDGSGRIIAVGDPVMIDNFEIEPWWTGSHYIFDNANTVSLPVNVDGLAQAYARALVNEYGTITSVLLYNETDGYQDFFSKSYGYYYSGRGYVTIPNVKVYPVGKTSVAKPAQLRAVVNPEGRISDIIIVDGGKGYDVKNDLTATEYPDYLNSTITTNGSSDFIYNINMGSGYHGDPNDIF